MGSTRDKVKRRVRKTVKWGGLVLTVLLVVVWIGSGWWQMYLSGGEGSELTVAAGKLIVYGPFYRLPSLTRGHVWFDTVPFVLQWWFDWGTNDDRWPFSIPIWHFAIPLWFPFLLSLLATAAAWRADAKYLRRVREGACPACGYDRAGLAAGSLCPECGMQPEAR